MYLGSILKPIPVTPDSYFLVPLIPNPPSLQDAFHHCHSARSRRRRRRIHRHEWTQTLQEVGLLITIGEGKLLSIPLHPSCQASYSQRRRFSFDFWNLDSATPGKPCVQNDLWVRWQNDIKVRRQNGWRNPFIRICIDKRLDRNHSN